jgi:hypothetical protein
VEPLLVAPVGKGWTFVLASGHKNWDEFHAPYAKRTKVPNSSGGRVFVGDTAPHELTYDQVRGFAENSDSRGNAAVHKVRGFEHTRAVVIDRHDDDIRRLDAIIENERPSSCPQNWSSNGEYGNTGKQHKDTQKSSRSEPLHGHRDCTSEQD